MLNQVVFCGRIYGKPKVVRTLDEKEKVKVKIELVNTLDEEESTEKKIVDCVLQHYDPRNKDIYKKGNIVGIF